MLFKIFCASYVGMKPHMLVVKIVFFPIYHVTISFSKPEDRLIGGQIDQSNAFALRYETIARQHAETAVATAGQVTAVAMRCESSRGDGDEVCGTDGKGKSSLVDALLVAAAVLSACRSES